MQLVDELKWCYSSWKLVEDGLFLVRLNREFLLYIEKASVMVKVQECGIKRTDDRTFTSIFFIIGAIFCVISIGTFLNL